jgi:hypothetical protein
MSKGLSIGILLGKGKHADASADKSMEDSEKMSSSETGDELPPGLLEAVTEFRAAETDEEAAKAFRSAMHCCEDM